MFMAHGSVSGARTVDICVCKRNRSYCIGSEKGLKTRFRTLATLQAQSNVIYIFPKPSALLWLCVLHVFVCVCFPSNSISLLTFLEIFQEVLGRKMSLEI